MALNRFREGGDAFEWRRVGAGGVIVGAGLLLGAIIYFILGGNPVAYLDQNLMGMEVPTVSDSEATEDTF